MNLSSGLLKMPPDESAISNGHVYDHQGNPIENATVYISWYEGDYWNTSSRKPTKQDFLKWID